MAIFKAVVHSDYAQIPNETAQDGSLSFEARGLLTMLLSLPPHWEVHKSWVVDKSPAGKDKVNSIFKELTDAGYIRREEGQRKFGKFAADDYFVFATKTTVADLPQRLDRSGSTGDGEPATRKETALEKKHKENKHSSVPPAGGTLTDQPAPGQNGEQYPGITGVKHKPEKPKRVPKWQQLHSKRSFTPLKPKLPANPDQPSSPKAGSESDSNTDKGVRRTDKTSNYPDEFEWLWKHKPGRIGANPKKKAYSACKARLKSGSSWREMAEGMKRYTVHCLSEGKLNTQYVMQMATFFGPDEHFKEQWSVQQPQEYQAPGSEQVGVDAPIYPSQIKNFSSANQTEEGQQQNEKIRQGLGSLRSQLNGEAK